MRYVIIGAGAIGGVIGARLAQSAGEHPPLLIARGEHGAVITRQGIRLRTPDEDVTLPIGTASGPTDVVLRDDDVLVLAVKTQQATAALADWVDAPVVDAGGATVGTAGERLPVFIAMNGIETERIALRLFDRVFGVCVWMPGVFLTPGEVISRISPSSGSLIIGRYGAEQKGEDAALLQVLAADWSAATFTIHLVADVMRWKNTKLITNLGNGVQALLGAGIESGAVVDRLRAEAEDVLRHAGMDWAGPVEEAEWRGDVFRMRPVADTPADMGGSSWQSIARGTGSIETDYLNGEIALIARQHGREAPLNVTIQRLCRQAAASDAFEPLSLAELEAQLDANLTRGS